MRNRRINVGGGLLALLRFNGHHQFPNTVECFSVHPAGSLLFWPGQCCCTALPSLLAVSLLAALCHHINDGREEHGGGGEQLCRASSVWVPNVVVIILPEAGACPAASCFLLWCACTCWSFRLPHDGKGHSAAINHRCAQPRWHSQCVGRVCAPHTLSLASCRRSGILTRPCRRCRFNSLHAAHFFDGGCKWLPSAGQGRLIFRRWNNSRVGGFFRVTGRIIISWECSWHTGRIFKNVKTLPDL